MSELREITEHFNFVKFMAPKKKVWQQIFFHPCLSLLFLDPGSEIRDPRSEIRDPGSEIRDPGWVNIRIRDKHPGSATLLDPCFSLNPDRSRLGFFWSKREVNGWKSSEKTRALQNKMCLFSLSSRIQIANPYPVWIRNTVFLLRKGQILKIVLLVGALTVIKTFEFLTVATVLWVPVHNFELFTCFYEITI